MVQLPDTKTRPFPKQAAKIEVFSSYVPENEFMRTAETPYVTVKKDVPQLFFLRYSSAPPDQCYGLLISASSAKNISLEFISMPIYIKEI